MNIPQNGGAVDLRLVLTLDSILHQLDTEITFDGSPFHPETYLAVLEMVSAIKKVIRIADKHIEETN